MTSPGKHTLPAPDAVPGWARAVLYVTAIVAPFAALIGGQLTGQETVAASVALIGAIGPAVAVAYQKKHADEDGAHYRAGYVAALANRETRARVVDSPQAGEHRGTPPTSTNTGGPLDGPHNGRGTP